jgi:PAS domain S-box-containing protein
MDLYKIHRSIIDNKTISNIRLEKLNMKLRLILLVLSLLAFLSASTGGYLYYSSLKRSALKESERKTARRAEMMRKNLSSFLSENIKPVKTMAGMQDFCDFLIRHDASSFDKANAMLDHFKATLDVDVCYLMDSDGNTVASSNRMDPDSFVGKNFAFRPYFQQAAKGIPSTYLALGTTSGKRGAYYSHPVYVEGRESPIGVVVIKASIELIEKELTTISGEVVLVTDPQGIVFISNLHKWLYLSIKKLTSKEISHISKSLQFGNGPWDWNGLKINERNFAEDHDGNKYLMHRLSLYNYPGWNVIHLSNLNTIAKILPSSLVKIIEPIIIVLCFLVGFTVFFLYKKASEELLKRKAFERALQKSEERYRSIYHNTPAMLHSVDPNGCLISVSDNWIEIMGYEREEVIGQKLTRFFTPDSKFYAETTVFPEFFKTGFCKYVPYQFVKKNGEVIDVLLSAIADRDEEGNITRSLAVSIDVSERIRAEKDLKLAKEELKRYSKDLERQVKKRTREINSILQYTPSVVYIKDKEGRYILVNSQFEELFGVKNDEVRGKTDDEIFSEKEAEQFRNNDQRVLLEKRSFQVEEQVRQKDDIHTYLSVKFPLYDESGNVISVCGISTDITDVKKAQDQLRRLSGSIITNQEKERSAIARELHDELGQVLTALNMDSVWLHDHLKDTDARAGQRALTMCELIDKTIAEVRSLAIRLRPGVLDDLGLVDALEWYTGDFERRTGITCVFEHSNIPPIRDNVATAAYRIAQEALTNVARHAFASRVEVDLQSNKSMMSLTVIDNGKGFNTSKMSETEALGLAGMRERATLVNGVLKLESQPRQGTKVHFKVPINGQKRRGLD